MRSNIGKKILWPFSLDVQSPQAQGLIGWWPGGPEIGQGRILADLSGYGFHGTLTAFGLTPTSGWTGGYQGGSNALRFDGTDDFVSVADNPGLTNSQMSISAWINFNTLSVTGIASKRLTALDNDEFNLLYRNDAGDGSFGAGFYLRTNGEATGGARYVITPDLGRWYHVCGTFNGTTKAVYVNGILGTSGAGAAIANGTANLVFGAINSAGSSYLNGRLEDIRLYKQCLTQPEVFESFRNPWGLRWTKTRSYFAPPQSANSGFFIFMG